MRTALAAGVLIAISASPAGAQPAPPVSLEARVAPGLVWHGAIFGDDSPKSAGAVRPTVSILVRGQTQRLVGLTFEALLEPIGVANPHFDESLHSLQLHVGAEIGRRIIVRPSAGVTVQVWLGSAAETGLGLAPAVGIAIGHRHAPAPGPGAGHWLLVHISPEIVARASVTHGAFSWMAGVQVPFAWQR